MRSTTAAAAAAVVVGEDDDNDEDDEDDENNLQEARKLRHEDENDGEVTVGLLAKRVAPVGLEEVEPLLREAAPEQQQVLVVVVVLVVECPNNSMI